jgi:hypothetical protein
MRVREHATKPLRSVRSLRTPRGSRHPVSSDRPGAESRRGRCPGGNQLAPTPQGRATVMSREIRLESGEREVVGSRVVSAAPDAERADRSVEDAMGAAATGRAIAAATTCEGKNQCRAQREQKREAAHRGRISRRSEPRHPDAKAGRQMCRPACTSLSPENYYLQATRRVAVRDFPFPCVNVTAICR